MRDPQIDNAPIDASEDIPSNTSANRPFRDVLASNMSRRKVVTGTLAGAASSFLAPTALAWKDDYSYSMNGG